MRNDPLAPLCNLPGVNQASEKVRDELAKLYRHRNNMRGWNVNATEAALRAARASSVLDNGPALVDESTTHNPIFSGALRVAQALEGGDTPLVTTWRQAPLQALARLHTLAAAKIVHDQEQLGRPRSSPDVGRRLEILADLATGSTQVPAPIFASIAHGELLTLAPFGSADGVVARGVSRLITIASGLDVHGLGIPEVVWMRNIGEYRSAAQEFATGTPEGITTWLLFCCKALHQGALEAMKIADIDRVK